mgnify:FL=1
MSDPDESAMLWRGDRTLSALDPGTVLTGELPVPGGGRVADPQDPFLTEPETHENTPKRARSKRGWLLHKTVVDEEPEQEDGDRAGAAGAGAHGAGQDSGAAGARRGAMRPVPGRPAPHRVFDHQFSIYDEDDAYASDASSSASSEGGLNGVRARRARHRFSSLLPSDAFSHFGNSVRSTLRRGLWSSSGTSTGSDELQPPPHPSHQLAHPSFTDWKETRRDTLRAPLLQATAGPFAPEEVFDEMALHSEPDEAPGAPASPSFPTRSTLPVRAGWVPWRACGLPLRKWHDSAYLALFSASIVATVVLDGLATGGASAPAQLTGPDIARPSPYYALTRSVPMLVLVLAATLGVALLCLRATRSALAFGAERVLHAGMVLVPALLLAVWAWAFAGSFVYDDEGRYGGAWSTTGLRILSLLPVAYAVRYAITIWTTRHASTRAAALLERVLRFSDASREALLPAQLGAMLAMLGVAGVFVTLLTRLFLVGTLNTRDNVLLWRTDRDALLLAVLTVLVWLWTGAVLQGVQGVMIAGTARAWHLAEGLEGEGDSAAAACAAARPAFVRASAPMLGSICCVALCATLARAALAVVSVGARLAQLLEHVVPLPMALPHARVAQRVLPTNLLARVLLCFSTTLTASTDACAGVILAIVGVTEADVWDATAFCAQVYRQPVVGESAVLLRTLLGQTVAALSLLAGVAGFLFSAHQLHVPSHALLVGVVFAVAPYCMLKLCANGLRDAYVERGRG